MTFPNGKKLGAIGIGLAGVESLNHFFDFVMYPLIIGLLGSIKGGIIMMVLALGLNYGLVLVYNKTKQDWFGFEWLRLQETKKTGLPVWQILRMGRWPAFGLLSWWDPFLAFVFIRGRLPAGSKFTAADWKWFFWANFLGNLIWILLVSGAIETIRRLFF